jgi:recombination protein RecT
MTDKEKEMIVSTQESVNSLRKLFNSPAVRAEMAKALPKHLTVDKMVRLAMTAIQTQPKLLDCSQMSILGCVMGAAALGLELERFTGQAYLVPFYNKKTRQMEAQLMPGYRGLVALARRSGEVTAISAQAVYAADSFEYRFGLDECLNHTPAEGDRGIFRGAYAIVTLRGGDKMWDFLPMIDIEAIRKRSQSSEQGPWMTDYAEMAKKTVLKRLLKLAPVSTELNQAMELDNRIVSGETQRDLIGGDLAEDDATAINQKRLAELRGKLESLQGEGNAAAGEPDPDKDARLPDDK